MLNKMIRLSLTLLIVFLTTSAVALQLLWTTRTSESDASNGAKVIPISQVIKEVVAFYELYDYYFDQTGYNKDQFVEAVKDWDLKGDALYTIDELTVFAVKANDGRGSYILVMCINKNKVDLVIFSNDITFHTNPIRTFPYNKEKFAKWFRTLLTE